MTQPEQPTKQPDPNIEAIVGDFHEAQTKEKSTLKKMWTAAGDFVRDIDTANKMAKDKFDGDSALMHAARGAVTTGVGAGLEKAMDFVWDRVWRGDTPFYDKSKFGTGMAESLNTFALDSNRKARLTYFIKEGTQDISLAVFYNFFAFRGQPLFPKVEAKHLIRSLGVDAVEALLSPKLPDDIRGRAQQSQTAVIEADLKQMRRDINDVRNQGNHAVSVDEMAELRLPQDVKDKYPGIENSLRSIINANKGNLTRKYTEWVQDYPDLIRDMQDTMVNRADELNEYKDVTTYVPGPIEDFVRNKLNFSNPITHLGVEWMASGVTTLWKNFWDVRKVRRERGGLEGKNVFMSKRDTRYSGDRRPSYDRRQSSGGRYSPDRKQEYQKDKVYYGKGTYDDQKRLEEYELKGN